MSHEVNPRKRRLDQYSPPAEHASTVSATVTLEKPSIDLPDRRQDLCLPCGKIDFHAIKSRRVTNTQGIHWLELGVRETLAQSHCPLCQLWYHSSSSTAGDDSLQLRSFSSNLTFTRFSKQDPIVKSDVALLATIPSKGNHVAHTQRTGYLSLTGIGEHPSLPSARIIKSTHFDPNLARAWLDYCCKNHAKLCSNASHPAIVSLRVLDCKTKRLVDAPPNCTYVALSYVWGRSNTEYTADNPVFPKTIQDSMEIVTQLSFRYLWVDRYCIDQNDKNDKHSQIAQMDMIYKSAALTIIAAAGEDPEYGLPGVGETARTPQRAVRIGSLDLIQTLPHPHWSLLNSRWAKRGWAYQEGILSHRRLIFTAEQVLWECDAMNCVEALHMPLDAMHTKDLSRFRAHIPPGSFASISPPGDAYEIVRGKVMRYICEYYERELSFPIDAINAIHGILKTFATGSPKLHHICGIPILWPVANRALNEAPNAMEQSIMRAFFWYHAESGNRRTEFPSWSWAGWQGGKLQPHLYRAEWLFNVQFYGIGISVEDVNGSMHSIPPSDEMPDFLTTLEQQASFIHLDAWTIDCEITTPSSIGPTYVAKGLEFSESHHAKFTLRSRDHASSSTEGEVATQVPLQTSHAKIHLSSLSAAEKAGLPTQGSYIGIVFVEHHKDHDMGEFGAAHVLVVEDRGEWYERVGCFHIYEEYWSRRALKQPNARPLEAMYENEAKGEPISWNKVRGWFHDIPKKRRQIRLG